MKNLPNITDPAAYQRGFTLIEVMITVAILAIGLLAVASMQIKSTQMNHSAMRITEAGTIAQEKLEQLLALPLNHPALQDAIPAVDDGNPSTGPEVTVFPNAAFPEANNPEGYVVRWDVDFNNPDANDTRIRVWVSWGEPRWFNRRTNNPEERETMLMIIRPQATG